MNKSIDIVVLGATGYTGKCVVKMLDILTKEKYWDVTWAVAGRSKEKLENLSTDLRKTENVKNLINIEVDIKNDQSLRKMLDMTKVVVNCTGPNFLLSPPIVKACIEARTHYVDISAEMLHMLHLQRDFHRRAEDTDVLIIPSCGFSSIPVEIGMVYLEREFKGILHSVECYCELLLPSWMPWKVVLHNGTWTSTVHVMKTFKEHLTLKREMFPPMESEPEELKKKLLINFPRLFTLGMVSEKGPTDNTRQNTKFRYTFNGKGWEADGDLENKPSKTLSVQVTGHDPGYDSTAIAIILCAITILKERSNMPKGGVVMPGAAFYKTDLIDRLMHEGYKFEVIS